MPARWVDVSHEALIRGWPRLRKWVEDDRAGLREHRRLTEAAHEWERLGRDDGGLFRGARLVQAAEWGDHNRETLNDLERAFLDASLALQRREVQARERLRRRVIVGLSAALIVTLGLIAVAGWQWRLAYVQGQIALARQVVAEAGLMGAEEDTLVVRTQLATEAMRRLIDVGARSLEVETAVRRGLALLPRHVADFDVGDAIGELLLSADGRLFTAGQFTAQRARIWDIGARTELLNVNYDGTLQGSLAGRPVELATRQSFEICAMTRTGARIAMRYDDGRQTTTEVWELTSNKRLLSVRMEASQGSCWLSPDGKFLAASGKGRDPSTNAATDNMTEVWDVERATKLGEIPLDEPQRFSTHGRLLMTDRAGWQIDAGGAAPVSRLAEWPHSFWVAMTPDDKYFAKREEGDEVGVWTTPTGAAPVKVHAFAPKPDVPLALSHDGRRMIVGGDGVVRVIETPGTEIARAGLDATDAAFTADGRALIVHRRTSSVWEIVHGGADFRRFDHRGDVSAAIFNGDGAVVTINAIAGREGALELHRWDVASGEERSGSPLSLEAYRAILSADGQRAASVGKDAIQVWRVGERDPIAAFPAIGEYTLLTLSPDGGYLAAAVGGTARVWNVTDKTLVGEVHYKNTAKAIAISSDGQSLAALFEQSTRREMITTVLRWTRTAGPAPSTFQLQESPATGATPGDTNQAQPRPSPTESTTATTSWTFDSSGLSTSATSDDGVYEATTTTAGVTIAEAASSKEIVRLDSPPGRSISGVFFGRDIRYLGTIDDKNTVSVWMLSPTDLVTEVCARLPANLPDGDEWKRRLSGQPYRKTCPEKP